MSSDWDEIRRLAADLQRAQLSGSIQKLSERNCIEIVGRLIQCGLVDVIYTTDGKEYLTPQQLQREIRDELFVARGRVSLVELAQTLNVDFSHVEAQAQSIAKSDSRVSLVLGQLVNATYLDFICEEINESLQLNGTVSISKLTKDYDLPSEYIQEEIVKRLGSIIEGFRDEHDPKTILTTSFVTRNKAKIRGALSGITVPTPVATIINRFKIQEQLFFSLADELLKTNRIAGSISGGKKASKATFTPHIYSRAQTRWIDDFMAQNGYLEYDAVSRLGISEPKSFIKKRFKEEEVHFLTTCCVGRPVFDSIESSVEDAMVFSSWLDVTPLLPSVLSPEDGNLVLQKALSQKKGSFHIFANTILFAQELLDKVEGSFDDLMQEQARKDVESKKYERLFSDQGASLDMTSDMQSDKKEERRKKAAGGKGGGGTQGRETKTKSTKKKFGKGGKKDNFDESDGDSDTNSHVAAKSAAAGKKKPVSDQQQTKIEYLSLKGLALKLAQISLLAECPEQLFVELADYFYPRLTKKYRALITEFHQSSVAASMQGKRKSHSELQEKCNTVISHIRLFEKGSEVFEGVEKKNLERHLMKTLCTELTNSIFSYFVEEPVSETESFSPEKRLKILSGVAKDEAEALLAIHKALSGGEDVGAFLQTVEENASRACDLFVRKPDKKRDRQLVFNHRLSLSEQLGACDDPALTLHLTVMIIFQAQFNAVLHASGKFVPQILQKISPNLDEESANILRRCQSLIMELINCEEEKRPPLAQELLDLTPKIKSLALSTRRPKGDE